MPSRCWRRVLLAATALLVWPATAHAHLVSTGFGPFYDGVIHLSMTPDDLLGVLSIALLCGLVGARHGRAGLFLLTTSWLVGGSLGLQLDREVSLPVANTLSFLVVGALVAAGRALPLALVGGLAVALGLLHGFLNGTAMAEAGGGMLALVGIATAVFVLTAVVAAFVAGLRPAWARVAVRVAGSWIAATGLLMLGWAFRAA